MKIEIDSISATQAAHLLYSELGPVVSWQDWLHDCRRQRAAPFCGLYLEPLGRDRSRKPVYELNAVIEFIERSKVELSHKGVLMPAALSPKVVAIDDTDHRHWTMRKLAA